jgi:hypothetical protein
MDAAVITTIQPPTKSVRALAPKLREHGMSLIVAGDEAGPAGYIKGADLLTLDMQRKSGFALAGLLPTRHYTRKNIAYLTAMQRGAARIYETDDDNAPMLHWSPKSISVSAHRARGTGWLNVYRHFTSKRIWPRGLPLGAIDSWHGASLTKTVYCSPIQQGLANGNPDVDAVYRLTNTGATIFGRRGSLALGPNQWCPFNSQNTWWFRQAFPLMYLPSYCTFRMTDIWRSFIAQRCLHQTGAVLTFHAPDVVQTRNHHDLIADLDQELPGYRHNHAIVDTLRHVKLAGSITDNLRACYVALATEGIMPIHELTLVDAWLVDCEKALR